MSMPAMPAMPAAATTKHVVCITSADSMPGFFAARACLASRDWAKVICQVMDDQDERAKMLASEGAHVVKMALDNVDEIKKCLLCNVDAMVMVPPPDMHAVMMVKCVMDAIELMKMPVMMPEPMPMDDMMMMMRGEAKMRALVMMSCVLAGFHAEKPMPMPAETEMAARESMQAAAGMTKMPNMMHLWEEMEKMVRARCKQATICRLDMPMQSMFALSDVMQNRGMMPLNFGDGECALVNLKDACCGMAMLACEMCAMMPGDGNGKMPATMPLTMMQMHHGQLYTFTGMQLITAPKLAQAASMALDAPMPYRAVDDHEMRRILDASSGMTTFEIDMFMACARMIRMGKMGMRSPDLERLIKRAPMTVEKFFAENKNMFKPRGGRVICAALLDHF
ncbi:hypothetical protein AMAG_07353 [Allomyces macrogynus ATCC 38327]|uniref:NmrA-like domain-containing protein n=1 Tax=Allomyces macrogynus (strain ATCC 38327) TaxID=578462 RepID=A0A0L0SHV9_ALLM3|nr:hypothetical protein AMAG_07353 [Allomyces macrogynus ATCC 38327]|eukprot:KNE62103.1 hypothetical protein AMAG_07353 [Allomyces macrogynus ATCC 38327]